MAYSDAYASSACHFIEFVFDTWKPLNYVMAAASIFVGIRSRRGPIVINAPR